MNGRLAALSLCVLAGLAGCRGRTSEAQNDAGRPPDPAASSSGASKGPGVRLFSFTRTPVSQAELPTTDGGIAIGNLSSRIKGIEGLLSHRPKDTEVKAELIDLLSARGDYVGRVADYERADALAEELVKDDPKSPVALLARAGTRAIFHRFNDALLDVEQAERLKGRKDAIRSLQGSILAALGRYDEALPLVRAAAEAWPTLSSVGAHAALLGQMGRLDEAEKLFVEALRRVRDTSPLPVAWLFFQEASMWERAGKPARAKELLEAAVSRLPAYAHAAAHLAAMEPYARGIEILTPIAEQADDPEPLAALADLLRKKGDTGAADAALAKAKARYNEVFAAHPEAYADHAARFWLNAGGDPKTSLAMAKKNLETRRTEEALDLVLVTALAAGSQPDACAAAKEGQKLAYASDLFRRTAADVAAKCP